MKEPTIRHTEFDFARNFWLYALTDGRIAIGDPHDARVPCGLPLNERTQAAANAARGVKVTVVPR